MLSPKISEMLDKVIDNIETKKKLPWDKGFLVPCINWFSKREYRGINLLFLCEGSGQYLTMNQLKKHNEANNTSFMVKKGTKAYWALYFKITETEITFAAYEKAKQGGSTAQVYVKDGKYFKKYATSRAYTLFDILDIEDKDGNTLPSRFGGTDAESNLSIFHLDVNMVVSKYLEGSGVTLVHTKEGAHNCYRKATDTISLVPRKVFKSENTYLNTLFHEMIHSTGVETRLSRSCFASYSGDKLERSKEEVVAEFGALMLSSDCGIPCNFEDEKNSEAYLTSWATYLRDNKESLISAVSQAEAAKQYILKYSYPDLYAEDTGDSD